MISSIRRRLKGATEEISLPAPARDARRRDAQGWPGTDPGPERVIEAGILWLYRAQDCSASRDGGVARHYSLVSGWASSYPETTGYIAPTLIAYATFERNAEARRRARTMLDWLVSIQLPSGGYQGGRVDTDVRSAVTFNTGQILIGLAAGIEEFGDYREPMQRAADWLLETQDPDGCWRRYPTPFAKPGEKAYETHVSWGLFEAERIAPQRGYADAALANVRWALGNQRENGWPDKCCLRDPARPLTHDRLFSARYPGGLPLFEGQCLPVRGPSDGRRTPQGRQAGRVPGRPPARRLVARGGLGVPHRGRADRAVLAHALPLYRRHALPGGGAHGESVGSLHH